MTKRFYKIREIPDDKIGDGIFEAPPGWDLYCVWTHPNGKTYGIFEKVEDV